MPDTDSMPDNDAAAPPAPPQKRSRRKVEYLIVLILIVIVVLAAYFQEPLSAFFRLRLWDRDAPGRVVTAFLTAAQKGDKATADKLLGATNLQPLMENGKWNGYYVVSMAGRMDFPLNELAPQGEPKPIGTKFITLGEGAAEVQVPDKRGTPVKYRLEMRNGEWKIMEILGGRSR